MLCAVSARAADADRSVFSFNGFGTLGVVHSSEDHADFTSSLYKPNGAGFSHNWSPDVDSLIGAQVTANVAPRLSAVLQVIAEQNYDKSYRPHVEWANIKYQFTADCSIRVGRTVLPAFLFSETRKVAYTYPWVRPPIEVYRLLPVTSEDGLDVSYRLHLGELTSTVQANAGRRTTHIVEGGTTEARDTWGVSDSTEYGPLTLQITYVKTHLTVSSLNSFFDVFRQFGPQGIAIADKYNSNAKPLSNIGVGASYDSGNWLVMSEWGHSHTPSFIGNSTAWYVSGGYRFGKFMPSITYSQAKADNLSDPGLNVSAVPPLVVGPATGLNAALNSILSTKPVQNTISAGARWDVLQNVSLKLQLDHTRIGAGSSGVLTNIQPGFQTGGEFTLFSVSIDFVF